MTITKDGYAVNEHNIIVTPGKFEGEHISILRFYDAALESSANEEVCIGETVYSFFIIEDEDRRRYSDLTQYGLMLWERSDGFVMSEWFATKEEYDAQLARAERQSIEDCEGE